MRFASKKYLSFILMVVFILQSLISSIAYAKSDNSAEAHRLPVLNSFPADGSSNIRPDSIIKIVLNPKDKNYNRFRQQFEKESFRVTLNGVTCESTYDKKNNVITLNSPVLERYTDYNVQLSLKADLRSPDNNSNNSTYSFKFKTGSAINEAVKLTADFVKLPERVTDVGQIGIKLTDDYGLPATNAIVRLSSDTQKVIAKELHIGADNNGEGVIEFTHHEKGKVLQILFHGIIITAARFQPRKSTRK